MAAKTSTIIPWAGCTSNFTVFLCLFLQEVFVRHCRWLKESLRKLSSPSPRNFIVCGSGCTKSEIWAQVLSRNLSSSTPLLAARALEQWSSYVLVPMKCYEYGSKGFLIFLWASKVCLSKGNHRVGLWSLASWNSCWAAAVLQLAETGAHFFRVASSH